MKKFNAFTLTEVFHPAEQSKRFAFTLAEVLITLGIIGVVAAMVIPVVMNNVRDKQLESQLAKAKYTLSNGYKLMMNRQEIFNVKDLEILSSCNNLNNVNCLSDNHKKYFKIVSDSTGSLKAEQMPESYSIKDSTENSPFKWSDVKYMFASVDGAIYGLVPSEDNLTIDIVTDINGIKKPNIASKDLYKFRVSGSGQIYDVSEELITASKCKWGNLDACTTREQCYSVALPDEYQGTRYFIGWDSWNEETDTGRCYFGYGG